MNELKEAWKGGSKGRREAWKQEMGGREQRREREREEGRKEGRGELEETIKVTSAGKDLVL